VRPPRKTRKRVICHLQNLADARATARKLGKASLCRKANRCTPDTSEIRNYRIGSAWDGRTRCTGRRPPAPAAPPGKSEPERP
jgi:hypothetical protein